MKIFALILAALSLSGCENAITRKYGGTMQVELPCNQKLMSVTWKEGDLWYLTRPMEMSEDPSLLTFKEKSLYGAMEGQVILSESRCKGE